MLVAGVALAVAAPNTLTPDEERDGWRLLWDGRSTDGWRSANAETFPARGWTILDGALVVQRSETHRPTGGDIVTHEVFSDFELSVDFKLTTGANSGIKYFIDPAQPTSIGLEYQLLDDAVHPDAKQGRDGNRTLGSVYDLYPAAPGKPVKPIGEWNTARIVSRGAYVEHWLNGEKVAEFERFTAPFRHRVRDSKYRSERGFGEWSAGRILLQDHGDEVHFRNVKIRVLTSPHHE